MTLTLLIDLDDTLLVNPLDKFFPEYIAALSTHLSPYIDPHKMVPQLLHSTDLMIAKENPCDTLQAVFESDFYPSLGVLKSQLTQPIADFYAGPYDKLRDVTKPIPAAARVMDMAQEQGWNVVIATNPLFPCSAVLKRLEWAGLDAGKYSYSMLTSYENMHFSKPNPAFYAEILGQLGWPEHPACMVGNSLSDDLVPAARLGIPCFWVNGASQDSLDSLPVNSTMGSLDELIPWLDRISKLPSLPEITDPEGILAVLKSTPAALAALTKKRKDLDWRRRPIHGQWSMLEIMCHLRDVEREVNLVRFELLSTTPNPFIPGVDSDRWAIERNYNEQDDSTVFDDFCSSRGRLLEVVKKYSPDDWMQSVMHSFFGRTTRLELAQFIAAHDRTHLKQMAQTIQTMR